jgi:hypothetical protein
MRPEDTERTCKLNADVKACPAGNLISGDLFQRPNQSCPRAVPKRCEDLLRSRLSNDHSTKHQSGKQGAIKSNASRLAGCNIKAATFMKPMPSCNLPSALERADGHHLESRKQARKTKVVVTGTARYHMAPSENKRGTLDDPRG